MSKYQIPLSAQRSKLMSSIRSKDTRPEMTVRAMLRRLGYPGYRLHRRDLPGKPDIAFIGRKKAITVHGCFWHGHTCKAGIKKPKTNLDYWLPKIERTQHRDVAAFEQLEKIGWRVLVIWECELKDASTVENSVQAFMRDP